MRPQSAKAKGRRLQQYVVAKILEWFPHLHPDDVTSRSMGAGGTDVLLSKEAQFVFPFGTECKNVEAFNIWAALAQAETNAGRGLAGLVVFKRNNTEVYCAMRFDVLLGLLKDSAYAKLI